MGSALLDQTPRDERERETTGRVESSSEALRQQVAERLAAHRSRRPGVQADSSAQASLPQTMRAAEGSHKSRIAATVAERYAQAQSYRAFLAAEAERALQQARAAAEIAVRNAQAVADARQQLLDRLAREQEPEIAAAVPGCELPEGGSFAAAEPMFWPELEALQVSAAEERPSSPRDAAQEGRARIAPKPRSQRAGEGMGAVASPGEGMHPQVELSSGGQQDGGLRVVLYEDLPAGAALRRDAAAPCSTAVRGKRDGRAGHSWDDAEALALDEEISFRQAPVFEEPAGPPMPLPANLIEFPRQLIASRKARPRYAEGPLRDDDAGTAQSGQLRIFEVETSQISTRPAEVESAEEEVAQWSSLWLDTPPSAASAGNLGERSASERQHVGAESALPYMAPPARPQTAALRRRALSSAIDGCLIGVAAVAFGVSFAVVAVHLADPNASWSLGALIDGVASAVQGVPLLSKVAGVGGTVGVLALVYQLLFFTFSEGTPGMRLARIGLCTFSDDNPTRRAMRLRILGLVLSTVTLGLGHLWAVLDEDHLTWQDLISRMYPRSY